MTKWEVVNKEDSDFIDIMAEGWYEVCRISKTNPRTATSRETADACLISATPDLLKYAEAEEQISQHFISCEDCDSREGDDHRCSVYWELEKSLRPYELRREALKKARGEGD